MLPNKPINILVVGGGGREHALCWKLAQSPLAKLVYCAPGNGGTATEPKVKNVAIQATDFAGLRKFAINSNIDFIVIGPDNQLADGIVDFLQKEKLRVFGPTKEQARLEWSKAYAKRFMTKIGLPTARYIVSDSLAHAQETAKQNPWAQVVKADGLAFGKGVFVCDDDAEVSQALSAIFSEKRFGESGNRVVLEEKLVGEELSLITLCDGKSLITLAPCQDHKRRFDDDKGPNTGGMGAYSPVELYDRYRNKIEREILSPLRSALTSGELSFTGVIYIGLMIANDKPYVIEFNARFGDPETQAMLPRLQSDLLPALWSCTEGTLTESQIAWSKDSSCCVVAAAKSYPESSSKDEPISINNLPSKAVLFHAGTKLADGKLLTNGGRVLSITALAPSLEAAHNLAYEALKQISFPSIDYRHDIARRAAKQCLSS
jgi:phosphoribosylamine--glycine ligase